MNYSHEINRITEALKADTNIPQPYRNSVISSARRLQLEIIGAQMITNKQEEPLVTNPGHREAIGMPLLACTCPAYPDMIDASCPVHSF